MIQHIVLFKLRPELDEVTIEGHMADFDALRTTVPAIESLEVRRDIVGRPVSADFGLIVGLADADGLAAYRDHPAHQEAFARLQPSLDHMLVLDYETRGPAR